MRLRAMALNTFRETVRDRLLYNLLVFALLMIGSTVYLATLTIAERMKIVQDFGLMAISLFGALIAIFIGVGLVYKELDRRTIYTVLSKPISRPEFLVGKYLGILLTLVVNIAIMAVALMAVLWGFRAPVTPTLMLAVYFIYLELMVLTAVTVLFSSVTTPVLAAIFTLCLFVIGQLSPDLKLLAAKADHPALSALTYGLYYLLPNLSLFDLTRQVVYAEPVASAHVAMVTAYALGYLLVVLLVSMAVFQRRDFK